MAGGWRRFSVFELYPQQIQNRIDLEGGLVEHQERPLRVFLRIPDHPAYGLLERFVLNLLERPVIEENLECEVTLCRKEIKQTLLAFVAGDIPTGSAGIFPVDRDAIMFRLERCDRFPEQLI